MLGIGVASDWLAVRNDVDEADEDDCAVSGEEDSLSNLQPTIPYTPCQQQQLKH